MFEKLFKSLGGPSAAPLTKITTPTGDLLPRLNASPEAQALYQPGQSPGEFLQVLEANQKPMESVNLLAHGMPEKDAVRWASESSKMVGDKLSPADQKALGAADAWLANPSPENQAAAARAAGETNGAGPGGWTAQAAAWAQPAAPAASAAGGGGGAAPGMAASAVAGAVMLAAGLSDQPAMSDEPRPNAELAKGILPKKALPATPAMPKTPATPAAPSLTPANAAAFSKKLKPFLDLGKKIASGTA